MYSLTSSRSNRKANATSSSPVPVHDASSQPSFIQKTTRKPQSCLNLIQQFGLEKIGNM